MTSRTTVTKGFTLVELLIVIVVIGILAAITLVAYNGVQQKARDASRQSALNTIEKGLEMYYIANGSYPSSGNSPSTAMSSGVWLTTADTSWGVLAAALKPYITPLPSDPTSTPGQSVLTATGNVFDFAYYSNSTGYYCGAGDNQMYVLAFKLESGAQENTIHTACTSGNPFPTYTGTSEIGDIK